MWIGREHLYKIYLYSVIMIGCCIFYFTFSQSMGIMNPTLLTLVITLSIGAQLIATSISNATGGTITHEVGTAISLAAVPTFGLGGGVVIVLAALVGLSIFQPRKNSIWDLPKFFFNSSMMIISISAAGWTLLLVIETWENLFLMTEVLSWLTAAVVYSILNLCLLIGIIRLQHGNKVSARKLFKENLWAMTIDILIMSVGGKLLSYSIEQYDVLGVIAFFLPIILCAFAFQVYAAKVKKHMDNLEAIIEERTGELKAVMQEKDHFLAVLTHDMKSPLTTINLYSAMLMKKPEKLIQQPKIAQTIYESQKNLADIVENILDLEKLQVDGTMPLNLTPIRLSTPLENTIDTLEVQAEKKSIVLTRDIDIPGVKIDADVGKLKRIFQNILSNSIKYTPDGGSVTVAASVVVNRVVISFEDTGYGISEEELPYIFDRFRRVAGHENLASGTGLGLAITKALVEAHDGVIHVKSRVDVGTKFTVSFPILVSSATPESSVAGSELTTIALT